MQVPIVHVGTTLVTHLIVSISSELKVIASTIIGGKLLITYC